MSDQSNRPSRIRISRSLEAFSLVLPVKTQPFRQILYTLWLALCITSEGLLLAGLAGWKGFPKVPEAWLIAMVALFGAAGVFIAWRFLWYHWGREVFSMDMKTLRARREILGVGKSFVFPLAKIRRVKAGSLHYQVVYPSWGRLLIGHGDHLIQLDAGAGPVAFARGLEEAEAADLAQLINHEVLSRTDLMEPAHTPAGGA